MLISSHHRAHVQRLSIVCSTFEASARYWLFRRLTSPVAGRKYLVTRPNSKTVGLWLCSSQRVNAHTRRLSTHDGGHLRTLLSSLSVNGTRKIFVTSRTLSLLLASQNSTKGAHTGPRISVFFFNPPPKRMNDDVTGLRHTAVTKLPKRLQLEQTALSLRCNRQFLLCM